MDPHNRWLRIILNLTMEAMEREKTRPKHDVLLVMDEFPMLGHTASLEKAAG